MTLNLKTCRIHDCTVQPTAVTRLRQIYISPGTYRMVSAHHSKNVHFPERRIFKPAL